MKPYRTILFALTFVSFTSVATWGAADLPMNSVPDSALVAFERGLTGDLLATAVARQDTCEEDAEQQGQCYHCAFCEMDGEGVGTCYYPQPEHTSYKWCYSWFEPWLNRRICNDWGNICVIEAPLPEVSLDGWVSCDGEDCPLLPREESQLRSMEGKDIVHRDCNGRLMAFRASVALDRAIATRTHVVVI